MTRLFFLAALMATITFSACGKAEQKMSAKDEALITSFATSLEKQICNYNSSDTVFKSVKFENNDLFITAEVNEYAIIPGMSAKAMFNIANKETLREKLVDEFFTDASPEEAEICDALRRNKCNLVVYFVGNRYQDTARLKIAYDKLP